MDDDVENLINEAIAKIKEGRIDDALLVLERTVSPVFGSPEEAQCALARTLPEPRCPLTKEMF